MNTNDVIFERDKDVRIPKKIFIFWAQGFENAPELVKLCAESWSSLNPGWEIEYLDFGRAQDLVDMKDLPKRLPWEAYADVLRLRLLQKFGGVWVDATLLCERPLDEWIGRYVREGFFVPYKPHPDREVSSWFIGANPDSELLSKWNNLTSFYWSHARRRDAYFWLHYLFAYAKITDKSFRRKWRKIPKVTPHKMLLVNRYITGRDGVGFEDVKKVRGHIPISKLTHKKNASVEKVRLYLDIGT